MTIISDDVLKEDHKGTEDVIPQKLDPEAGVEISVEFNPEIFQQEEVSEIGEHKKHTSSTKAKVYKKAHKSKEKPVSDLQEMEKLYHRSEPETGLKDLMQMPEIPQDYEETLVSLEEMMEFLDTSEKEIDV